MRLSILRPGLLVVVNSHVIGGVQYRRVDLDASGADRPVGVEVTRWETTKVVDDPEEHDRAVKARGKALAEIDAVCVQSKFARLCPTDRAGELEEAIGRAQAIVSAHNADATCTRVELFTFLGQVAATDEQATRKIAREMTELFAEMSRGIDRMDPEAIREANKRAIEVAGMLGEEQVKAVSEAVEQAKKAARDITRRIGKKGEDAAIVLASIQRGAIERARFAFLDTDDSPAVIAEPTAQANVQRFADMGEDSPAVESSPEPSPEPSPAGDVAGESPRSDESIAASAQ
jgi:hypothetical protein